MKSPVYKLLALLIVAALSFILSGCQATMSGATRDDTTLTDTAKELEQAGINVADYRGPKMRVGVVNFENKTASKSFGIGEAASDILGTILQKTNRFIIIASQDMKRVLEHQAMGASGMINQDTAAKLGQVLGLNALISGAITAYSEAEEGGDYGLFKSKKQIARITVDYRVVDATTGTQLLAHSGAGIYEKKISQVLGMGSRASYDTALRDGALRDALNKATVNIVKQLEKRKWSGRIASSKGSQIYVNAGAKSGINVEDKLAVYRPGDDIIDPSTRVKIGTEETFVGEIKIVQNDLGDSGDLSLASPLSGSVFKAGDIVKLSGK